MIILAIAIIVSMLIGSLVFWGIGNLIIFVFGISYTWTLLHGFIVYLVLVLLKDF